MPRKPIADLLIQTLGTRPSILMLSPGGMTECA
jgi:hypothetical protein